MTNSSLISQCTAGLKTATDTKAHLDKQASDAVTQKLNEKLEARLQQKEARAGNAANVALAMKCRPGMFPGLRDTPVAMDDPKGLMDNIQFDPKTLAYLQTANRAE